MSPLRRLHIQLPPVDLSKIQFIFLSLMCEGFVCAILFMELLSLNNFSHWEILTYLHSSSDITSCSSFPIILMCRLVSVSIFLAAFCINTAYFSMLNSNDLLYRSLSTYFVCIENIDCTLYFFNFHVHTT